MFGSTQLGPLEQALVACLVRLEPQADQKVLMAAALCVQVLAQGDVCLDLARWAEKQPWPEAPVLPPVDDWLALLRASSLVGLADSNSYRPLILEEHRLYLARYHAYEQQLAAQLRERIQNKPAVDEAQLKQSLERLFESNTQNPDWQRVAAAQAVRNAVAVISGGPGTGKTTTVVRLLAALLEQPEGQHLSIGLAAPTGKAAARMAEAMRNAKAKLKLSDDLKALLPDEASTLHRLLGARGDTPKVLHHAQNPLLLDVLVVDEASMVDLALMAKLIEALPKTARLILLGDKDQLTAVEAGAVFAELCKSAGLTPQTHEDLNALTLQQLPPTPPPQSVLGEAVVLLTHSHRFASDGCIGRLASDINEGKEQAVLDLLKAKDSELTWEAKPQPQLLLNRLYAAYMDYLTICQQKDCTPVEAFKYFGQFQALTALREGPYGLTTLNEQLEARIKRQAQLKPHERWYAGRAIMVTHNDYALGLFNGDVGICLNSPQGLRVFFEAEGEARSFAPARLPSHETAFVITVHKSQGSEFDQVLLVLPEVLSEQSTGLVSRALLYTGITRARHKVEIWATEKTLKATVALETQRTAGLAQRLALEPPL